MQFSSVLMWKVIYCTSLSDGKSYCLVLSDNLWHNTEGSSKSNSQIWCFLRPDKDPIKIEVPSVEVLYVECCSGGTTSARSAIWACCEHWKPWVEIEFFNRVQLVNIMLEGSEELAAPWGARGLKTTWCVLLFQQPLQPQRREVSQGCKWVFTYQIHEMMIGDLYVQNPYSLQAQFWTVAPTS